MGLFRHWRRMGPIAIMSILLVELLLDLPLNLMGDASFNRMHARLDIALVTASLAVLALAARRMQQMVRTEQSRVRHHARLCDLGHAALSQADAEQMFKRCTTLLVDVLKCDAAAFVQCDPQQDAWHIRAAVGRDASFLPRETELHHGPGSFGEYVLHTSAQPVSVKKFNREHRFSMPTVLEANFGSVTAVRVQVDATSYGCLVAVFRRATACDAYTASFSRSLAAILARYLHTRRTLSELRAGEDLFRQLADHVQDALYLANADGSKIHYVSPAYEKIWQTSATALYKNPRAWLNSIHEEDRQEAMQVLRDHRSGEFYERNYRVVRPDGTVRWICDRSFPISDPQGGVDRVAGLAADITDVRQARDVANQLVLANERTARTRAETRIRTRDEVLAIVSHDLRTPLTTIVMAAQRLQGRSLDDALAHKLATRIHRAADRMERLVQDLLEVSRLESGVLRLEKRSIKSKELWQEATEAFESHNGQVPVVFMPLGGEVGTLCVDSMRVLQVLGNLINNAVGFTPEGGRVQVSAELVDGELLFCVQDEGPGIGAEQMERLFEPFWQGSHHDKRGLGLGLHIARGIVEAHGGKIGARGVEPHGTAVWFSMPREAREGRAPAVHEMPAMDHSLN